MFYFKVGQFEKSILKSPQRGPKKIVQGKERSERHPGCLKFPKRPARKGRQNLEQFCRPFRASIQINHRYPGLKPWAILSGPLRTTVFRACLFYWVQTLPYFFRQLNFSRKNSSLSNGFP